MSPTEAASSRAAFSAAKSRAIAIPVDLDSQVNNLFLKSHNIVQKTALNWRLSARNAARRDSVLAASRDYRNIIERLQVLRGAASLPGGGGPCTQLCFWSQGKAQAGGGAGGAVSAVRGPRTDGRPGGELPARGELPTVAVFKGCS